jgi:hypothetical protein
MQTDNVSNQREHLILLLANIHIRKNPKTDEHSKVFFCLYTFKPRLNSSFLTFTTGICHLWDLMFHNSRCSWMIMRWMMWWKSCLRTTKSGANILVGRVAFGDFLKTLFYILLSNFSALNVCKVFCLEVDSSVMVPYVCLVDWISITIKSLGSW